MRLTPRERAAVELLVVGADYRQVSLVLANREQSVKNMMYALKDRIGADSNAQLVYLLCKAGLI